MNAKFRRILGVSVIALIATSSLAGCKAVKELTPLPDEERYHRIDRVLADIDYQNIGEVVFEVKDDGDGVFSSSYKRVGINGVELFDKVAKRLASPKDPNISEKCEYYENKTQMICPYNGTQVTLNKNTSGISIKITDSSNGRASK